MPARSPSTSAAATGLRREAALYFRLAGGAPQPDDAEPLRRLAHGVDWDRLRAIARRDGTTAAVHRRLALAGVAMPAVAAAGFAREARVLDFHRLVLERAVEGAVRRLTAAGLRVVLLKGAALARTAYAAPTDRPMSDADLLLAPDEAREAAALLGAHGWARRHPGAAVGASDDPYRAHHHLPPLRAPGGGDAVVELHHDVLPAGHPFAWDGAAVLSRARPVPGVDALVPDCADLLLHACLHFAWSHEMRHGAWRTFADLAAVVARHADAGRCGVAAGGAECAAVDRLADRARAARATSAVAWTLRLARDLGGVALPPGLAELAAAAGGRPALGRHLAGELVPGGEAAPSVLLSRLLWARAVRPDRSGHGAARPWRVGAGGVPGRGAAAAGGDRALAQLRRLGAWRRYGRRLIGA